METFIYKSKINKKVCKDILDYFLKNRHKHVKPDFDEEVKTATEIPISVSNNEYPFNKYKDELQKCVNKYRKKYKEVDNNLDRWNLIEDYNIQYYKPKQGFKKVHCERSEKKNAKRVLVFMTYLTTVKNAGTIWPRQKFISECILGDTLIWPTDFTHIHKGIISKDKDKCIVTGWYTFE